MVLDQIKFFLKNENILVKNITVQFTSHKPCIILQNYTQNCRLKSKRRNLVFYCSAE